MTCYICASNTCLGECEPPIAYIENLEREVAELKERLHELAADWQVKHYEIEELKVNNKLIAELESDYNRILSDFLELQAHINLLREAFEEIDMQLKNGFVRCKTCGDQENTKDFDCRIWIADALASTPAQSLQVHDNEVIERCAKVVESFKEADPYTGEVFTSDVNDILNECIEAIKELKGEL